MSSPRSSSPRSSSPRSSSPRSSSPRSSSPRSSSSPKNQGLDLVNEDSADKNMLEQLGKNILDFINTGVETGGQTVKGIASFVTDKIKEYNQSRSIKEMTSVEKMTPVESFFNGQIKAKPDKRKRLELKKLTKDTYFTFHPVNRYLLIKDKIKLDNKVELVRSAVEYHYGIIDERLTQIQRFRVIQNAMSAAIEYINENKTDFLSPYNITSEYEDKVKQVVQDAIILAQSKFTAQSKITGGRKNPTKGRPKRPRSSIKPRSTRKK